MYKKLKTRFYETAKAVGLFRLTARAYAKRLRIICFHGVSVADEHLWHPGLFLEPRVFRERLELIKKGGFVVLDLDDALARLQDNTLPENALVLTFDDGFANNFSLVLPLMKEYGFPFTVYTSSYHVTHASPVFRLVVQYLLWKWKMRRMEKSESSAFLLDMSCICRQADALGVFDLQSCGDCRLMQDKLIEFGEACLTDGQRTECLWHLAHALGLTEEMQRLERDRIFHFMTPQELREMEASGLARIELHTHSHPILTSAEQTHREIQANKLALESIVGRPLRHFCYPSGIWSPDFWSSLEVNKISSATTCEPGLSTARTPPFALGRYLDSSNNSGLEFEAEIYGFGELMRFVRDSLRRRHLRGLGLSRGS